MSTSKNTYHHGDLRATILKAAGKLLEKEGLNALSLREVARRAGVSHNAPYRHFPDRDRLLAALAEEGFAELGRALGEAGKRGPRERGEAYVRFALTHPQRFRLMFGGVLRIGDHPGLREKAAGAYEGLVSAFSTMGEPR